MEGVFFFFLNEDMLFNGSPTELIKKIGRKAMTLKIRALDI